MQWWRLYIIRNVSTFQCNYNWRTKIPNKTTGTTTDSEMAQKSISCQLKIRTSCCRHVCDSWTSTTIRTDGVLHICHRTVRSDRSPVEHHNSWLDISKVEIVRRWIKVYCCNVRSILCESSSIVLLCIAHT